MKLKILNLEALIWILGLTYLYFADVNSHYSFCLFKNLGFEFCPGCGLGRSIHYLMHCQINKSVSIHPLGLFALPVLIYRIISIFNQGFSKKHLLLNQGGSNE